VESTFPQSEKLALKGSCPNSEKDYLKKKKMLNFCCSEKEKGGKAGMEH